MSQALRSAAATSILGWFLVTTGFPAPALAQDVQNSRELAGISEEQAQVQRQLGRLRSTMEVLLQRMDAEGRVQTAELLRGAIEKLDARSAPNESSRPMTMEERMAEARSALGDGQLVQSIERQQELVAELEQLISILLDRKNFEALEEKIAELRELREEVDALAREESELREETAKLKESSANASHQELEAQLSKMVERQRELLAENEALGRSSGTLELEQLERELEELLRDQATDAEVMESWDPTESAELAELGAKLSEAQRAEARAALLEQAAKELSETARATESAPAGAEAAQLERLLSELKQALERAQLESDASGDEAAQQAAEALEAGTRALEAAQRQAEGEDPTGTAPSEALEAASSELDRQAKSMQAAARSERSAAQAAREETARELEGLEARDSAGSAAAEEALEALERADAAHRADQREDAAGATDDALAALEGARKDMERLGEALSASQHDQAQRTERIQRGLSTLPNAETASGQEAKEALGEAAEAMREASSAARQGDPGRAAPEAQRGVQALRRAREALATSRQEAAGAAAKATQALSQSQAQAAQETQDMQGLVPESAMESGASEEVEASLEQAAEAMQRAAEDLAEGRSASAAAQQRQAMQALQQAQSQADQGVAPQSSADKARAEELAQEQERIREEILDLARRLEEREEPGSRDSSQSMQRASDAAQEATEQLQSGDLAEAEESEREVEQELKQTQDDLAEEEERYQRLRDEEQLFRIAEELQALIEGHRAQMVELIEIDSQRKPASAPSRAQRLRLRRVAREEETLGERALEIAEAISAEGALVSGKLLENTADDLARIGDALSEEGGHETGERTQALQRDVEESLMWLFDALQQEQDRRKKESAEEQPPQEQPGEESRPPLIPDAAELKLLKRMEVEVRDSVDLILALNPDLDDIESVEPRVLREIARLANRHNQVTELFKSMRRRVGVPDPAPTQESSDEESSGAEERGS